MGESGDTSDSGSNPIALEVGARLERGPSKQLIETAFANDLAVQLSLTSAISLADLAHTLCAINSGSIPIDPGTELVRALLELHEQPSSFKPVPAEGDLYTNREAWLGKRTRAVDWLGCGRARREATTAAYLLNTRSGLLSLAAALIELANGATAAAAKHRAALMPDYTYLQTAQPTSFGHYLLGFVYPMLRDLDRLRAAFTRVNASPLGCGSTNGSRFAFERDLAANALGFDSVSMHARDAMWQADVPIELAALLSASVINVDRLAEDLQVFATQEFSLVELCDSHSRASKIMPQKKNPFALTHIRGVANEIIGTATSLSACARSPSGQPDNRFMVYGQLPTAIDRVTGTLYLMRDVLLELRFDAERGSQLVTPATLATDLAETLVIETGLAPRSAHRLVGHLVREHGGGLTGLTTADITGAAQRLFGHPTTISSQSLQAALDPRRALAARETPGGAGSHAMTVMLDQCVASLKSHSEWHAATRARLDDSETLLLERAKALVATS
ncbi:MAG: lyase family protein [Pseudomonadales bacterium]